MKIHKKILGGLAGLFAVTALLNVAAVIVTTRTASAAPSFVWLDKTTIQATAWDPGDGTARNVKFVDSTPNDSTRKFVADYKVGNCKASSISPDKGKNNGQGTLLKISKTKTDARQTASADGCYTNSEVIRLGAAAKSDDQPPTAATNPTIAERGSPTAAAAEGGSPPAATNNNPASDTASGNEADITCGGNPLSWISCALVEVLSAAVDGIFDKIIQPLLKTDPLPLDNVNPTYKVWSSLRILANIFLIIALLVIVFGQTIGGGLIDAYSAKKTLPRLLAAAILINISYYIVALAIDVTNVIGSGLGGLIEQPFKDTGTYKFQLDGTGGAISSGGVVAALYVVKVGGLEFMQFVGVMFLIGALLTVLAILATLMLRTGLIILLVIVSPVAFALYALPNTEQYFRKWWDLLTKTLLVYPIIAVLFAMGNVMSITIGLAAKESNAINGAIADFMSIIALFVPLFLIPFSFKLAGGILGKISEVANGISKRGAESIKGNPNDPNSLRNRSRKNLGAKLAAGNLSGRAIGTRLNPTTMVGSRRTLRKASLAATRNTMESYYGKQGMGAYAYEAYKDDSNVMGELAKHKSGSAARAQIEKDIADRKLERGSGDHEQRLFSVAAAEKIGYSPDMRRRALLNPSTIGYELSAGEKGWDEATEIMEQIAGGKTGASAGAYRSMVNEFQYLAKSAAGRADLAGAVDGGEYDGYRAWGSIGMYQHGNGKPKSIKGASEYFQNLYERAENGNMQDLDIENFAGVSRKDYAAMDPTKQREVRVKAAEGAKDAVAVFASEMGTLGSSATGAVRDEALKQRDVLLGNNDALTQRTKEERVKRAVRGYDPTDRDAEMARRAAEGPA